MKAKMWLARRKLQQQRDKNSVRIKKRKHIRKQALEMGIIPDDDEEIELREQFQQPTNRKKFQLEPIEEEDIVSESAISNRVLLN